MSVSCPVECEWKWYVSLPRLALQNPPCQILCAVFSTTVLMEICTLLAEEDGTNGRKDLGPRSHSWEESHCKHRSLYAQEINF